MASFGFFSMRQRIEIDIDESKTVGELIEAVYEKYAFPIKAPLESVTVYDMKNYHVVTSRKRTIKQEKLSSALCFAYFKKGEFLFVEGSWGHHMIKMDAVKEIKKPFMFRMSVTSRIVEFEHFVAAEKMSFEKLYSALVQGGYITDAKNVIVSYSDITNSKFETAKCIPVSDAIKNKLTVFDLIREYEMPQCMVISFTR